MKGKRESENDEKTRRRGLKSALRTEKKELTLLDHIRELRNRLIVSVIALCLASVAAYVFYDRLVELLYAPFQGLSGPGGTSPLYLNNLLEGFATRINVALLAGFVLSFPVHLFNIVRFIFPGLTPKERRIVGWSLATSTVLAAASLYYRYVLIVPLVIKVLTGAAFVPKSVGLMLNYSKNIFLVFQFVLACLVMFQLPLVAELLMILNVVTRKAMIGAFRYIVVGIFIVAAVLTPPDAVSQVMVAVPLVALFALVLLIAKIFRFGEG